MEFIKLHNNTLYYGEYVNYGPGAGLAEHVNLSGYNVLSISAANEFSVAGFIEGNK